MTLSKNSKSPNTILRSLSRMMRSFFLVLAIVLLFDIKSAVVYGEIQLPERLLNKRKPHHSSSSSEGAAACPAKPLQRPIQSEHIAIDPAGTLATFHFYDPNTWALQDFYFYTAQPVSLNVFDCYCGGDMFKVFDNGRLIGTVNTDCNGATSNCNIYSSDPQTCLTTAGFCKLATRLGAGSHNITIKVMVNYYRAGVGYIFVQPAATQ